MLASAVLASLRRCAAAKPQSFSRRLSSRLCPSVTTTCASGPWKRNATQFKHGTLKTSSSKARYSASSTLNAAHKQRIFQDSHRPEVFYHLVDAPTPVSATNEAYAISFLDSIEAQVGHAGTSGMGSEGGNVSTVIGWVPLNEDGKPVWSAFKENPTFRSLLHETIYAALRDGIDEVWVSGAKQIGSGWMHLNDQRNPPALGRIGDPDDIIGTVLVEDGSIKAETYQAMPSYRVYTPTDGAKDSIGGHGRELGGFMKLTPGLLRRLIQSASRAGANEEVQRPV